MAFNGFADTAEVTGEVWRGPKARLTFRYRWLFTSTVDALVRCPVIPHGGEARRAPQPAVAGLSA